MYPKLKAVADRSAPAGTTSFSLSSALSPSLWFTRSLFPWSLPSLPCLRPTVTLSQAQLLSHTCVSKSAGQLLPWEWKGQPPCPLPNLTSSLSYDSLSLCVTYSAARSPSVCRPQQTVCSLTAADGGSAELQGCCRVHLLCFLSFISAFPLQCAGTSRVKSWRDKLCFSYSWLL